MNVLGLIVEYNPFHNGHKYHLEKSKQLCSADFTICVMSGNFIQRGEPSIINKWARSEMALLAGVDLVIEIPHVYAMSTAEFFGYSAIKLLDSLGIVTHVCFGSEHGKIDELERISDILIDEPPSYKKHLKLCLKQGLSYASSRECAVKEYFLENSDDFKVDTNIMSSSNNILAIEYLKAIKRIKSTIRPTTIKRVSNSYNEKELTGSISSATAIRNKVKSEGINGLSIASSLPPYCLSILNETFNNKKGPVFIESFDSIIMSLLRKKSIDEIKNLPYVSEGLENRIKKTSLKTTSINEFIDNVATKRYTKTRIQRILFSMLSGLTANELEIFNEYGGPQYIRVLGFNEKGRDVLSKIKKTATLPVITKPAHYTRSCNPLLRKMLDYDSLSTDLYVLAYNNPRHMKAGVEFTKSPVII